MEFKKVVQYRQSIRAFKDEQIPDNFVSEILECGMKAPIGKGEYNRYTLLVLQGDKLKTFQKMLIAKTGHDETYNSPLLILVMAIILRPELDYQNTGCILENMCLEATNLTYGSTYLWSVARILQENKDLKNYLGIDENTTILGGVTIGKPTDEYKFIDKEHKIKVIYQ